MIGKPVRYEEYEPGRSCSAEGCKRPAEFEVYLYDYYPSANAEFFEQDYTCPFLCEQHMEENEARAKGVRESRGSVDYPFSNRHGAQGYSKYAPLKEAYPVLFSLGEAPGNSGVIESVAAVNEKLIAHLAHCPELLYNLEPRRFEELVAELLKAQGFEATLTPRTRDGGRDILAARSDRLGTLLYRVECKRYAPAKKVGVEVVRSIYGVVQSERANKGVIVTTSSFTTQALAFATPLRYQLSLRDFGALTRWLDDFRGSAARRPATAKE